MRVWYMELTYQKPYTLLSPHSNANPAYAKEMGRLQNPKLFNKSNDALMHMPRTIL